MRVALALGSGGARGYAHIGALQELEERGHEVVRIAGTSMGALVGGLYCAGKLDDFTEWVVGLNQRDVLMLMDPALIGPGVIKAERVVGQVSEILNGARIEDLPIPYTAIATDVENRREVWFVEGPVDVAIRASIAIPTFITPVVINGRLLVDGGILNPVPVDASNGSNADFTMAISLSGSTEREGGGHVTETSEPAGDEAPAAWFNRLVSSFGFVDPERLRLKPNRVQELPGADGGREPLPHGLRTTELMTMALSTTEAMITRYRLAGNPPDVFVQIPNDACGTLDFHRASEMIAMGRRAAEKALDEAGL